MVDDRVWKQLTGYSFRTQASRDREEAQIAQRQRNGELAPGQRSINQPWNRD